MQLPFVLVEKIIQNIVHDLSFRRTINSCSLVSRSWLPAARQRFFLGYTLTLPSSDQRFSDLKALCQSPLSTLHFTRIQVLSMDPKNTLIAPFLEWYTSVGCSNSNTLKGITINQPTSIMLSCTIPNHLVQSILTPSHFPAITSLRLNGFTFTSSSQLMQFLDSFPRLEFLQCTRVIVHERSPPGRARLALEQLRSLETDYDGFFNALNEYITFPRLRSLMFNDIIQWPGKCVEERLRSIGEIIEYAGRWLHDLVVIFGKLISAKDIPYLSTITPQIFDLSKKTPILRRLTIFIQPQLFISALEFSCPHPTLASITIDHCPLDFAAYDARLRESTPALEVLVFPLFVSMDMRTIGLEKRKQVLGMIVDKMPWCAEGGRLSPDSAWMCQL